MKDIFTTGLGMFIFGDVTFEPKNVIGVSVGLTGGILYAYFSYRDSQQRAAVSATTLCQLIDASHAFTTPCTCIRLHLDAALCSVAAQNPPCMEHLRPAEC